jgi:hypothetical protein
MVAMERQDFGNQRSIAVTLSDSSKLNIFRINLRLVFVSITVLLLHMIAQVVASRILLPAARAPEDPATFSAHAMLAIDVPLAVAITRAATVNLVAHITEPVTIAVLLWLGVLGGTTYWRRHGRLVHCSTRRVGAGVCNTGIAKVSANRVFLT